MCLAQPSFGQFIKQSDEDEFTLEFGDREDDFTIDLNALNDRSYTFDFYIRVPDLTNVTDDETLQKLDIRTKTGEEVYHRVRIDDGNRTFILGSLVDGRNLRISDFKNEDNIPQITFSVNDIEKGRLRDIDPGDIVIFDDGREECFDYQKPFEANVSFSVGIAIDISGSMSRFRSQIDQSIREFARNVDSSAYCSVTEFNHDYRTIIGGSGQYQSCSALRNFSVSRPSGGTAIFPALRKTYEMVQEQNSDIELVLVVSDGASDNSQFNEALGQKQGTTTFVNWLGSYNPDYPLEQFADAEIFGSVEPNGSLPDFFQAASMTVSGQFVARPCGF